MNRIRRLPISDFAIIAIGIALAIAIRYSLLNFQSVDYAVYTRHWYTYIKAHGFSAFGQNFSNYNPPYLYLLYIIIRFFPDLPGLIATKLPSMIADFVCAGLAYKIVSIKYPKSTIPMFAMFAILFAPTVVLNSAFWGQADALYTVALITCIYFLLIKRPALAMLFFGISISFKAQAVFLLPLLFALLLKREIPWKYLLIVPLIMFISLVPAWIAGRSAMDLLLIYPSQASQYQQLSMHAPSLLSLIPNLGRFYPYFYPAGLILAIAVGSLFSVLMYKSQAKLTPPLLIELSLISVMVMPFVLPKMLDRYFYPADVFSILFAFYFPSYFYIPIGMNIISFFAYQPTLFQVDPVPIGILALGVLVLIIVLIKGAIVNLAKNEHETPASYQGTNNSD
jgi:Gpi18-like mannosyltransferase